MQSQQQTQQEQQQQQQQSQASPDSTATNQSRALTLSKSINNGYHNHHHHQSSYDTKNFYEQSFHHVHHHHVHHHHHHVLHYDGKSSPNEGATICANRPTNTMATIMAAVEVLMEGDLILQALNGFLLILTCEGEVFYTSHTVETYLGFHQVGGKSLREKEKKRKYVHNKLTRTNLNCNI